MPPAIRLPDRLSRSALTLVGCVVLASCAGPRTVALSSGHNMSKPPQPAIARPTVQAVVPTPRPEPTVPVEMYTVVVKNVPVVDLLFSLARDAGLNLDLQADNKRTVTLNAVDRPLREILSRIAKQAKLRFRLRGNNLIVEEDAPYWHNYLVKY